MRAGDVEDDVHCGRSGRRGASLARVRLDQVGTDLGDELGREKVALYAPFRAVLPKLAPPSSSSQPATTNQRHLAHQAPSRE